MTLQRMQKPPETAHVESPHVTVSAPQIQVESPSVHVPVDVHIDNITVRPPVTKVESPTVWLKGFTLNINLPSLPQPFLWGIIGSLLLNPIIYLAVNAFK